MAEIRPRHLEGAVARIPIIKMGDFLLVSVQVELHDELALRLEEDLAVKIDETGARGVLIDVSGLQVVDSFVGRVIGDVAAVAALLDCRTVLVGIQPAVAMTLVTLGLTLDKVRTALSVEQGMELLGAPVRWGANGNRRQG